ncbi:DNA-binding SARP family transcriptional activator [Micromonospora pisi]|uniref:DNA-binding SARP family transcriptional activator n=1 Tax=Micromonospora pisi TaxID=589240 RepID=A0A495JQU6_9ACTN|nr:DNA-binding SARP family transcriptional activator [Micromonospora pisi]
MEFGLLGNIDAHLAGKPIDLGHSRQRSVLAALLVDVNKVVHVDQLLDRVWADSRPQRSQNVVYGYLSRLRRCLADAEGVSLGRRAGGYLLTADPLTVDLHQFRHLAAQARGAERDDDALRRFDEAVTLWRGEPFAGLDTPWFNSLRESLERERLAVEHDRIDTALRCGEHAALLPDLARRAGEQPLDERLAGQLMLALYRCGRQAEALGHFQRVRHQLVDAMGVDPGPDLQNLQLRILNADPSLSSPIEVRVSPAATAPGPTLRQLPTPPPLFTGRESELAELTSRYDTRAGTADSVAIVAISGAGGVGKTWLALRWAHDNSDRFPDGQLYVNLRGFDPSATPLSPLVAVRGFLDALGVPPSSVPADLDAQAGLYRSLVADRRLLIVLDNAYDTAQVLPLLPGSPTCTVLLTSRRRLGGLVATHGAQPLALDVLRDDESEELLARLLGPARMVAEPASVSAILQRCAGLPLALGIVAARAATHPGFPLQALADELAELTTRLDVLTTGDLSADLRTVFAASYRALNPATATVFTLLGLAPGPDISLPAVASLTGIPAGRARALLQELHEAHLVHQDSPGRYRLHDLVRLYAAEQAEQDQPADARRAGLHRLLEHYTRVAATAGGLLDPERHPVGPADPIPTGVTLSRVGNRAEALSWFNQEHMVLLGAVDLADSVGFDRHAWELARGLESFLDDQGHWHDWAATQRTALKAAHRLGDRTRQAHSYRSLGLDYTQMGRLDDGHLHLRQALDLYEELGDRTLQAHTHRGLGWVCNQQDRWRDGLSHNERALALYRETGHRAGEAVTLNNLGWLNVMLDDYPAALTYCTQAVALNQEIGDPHAEAGGWDSLGYAHHHLGEYDQAIRCYQRALELVRSFRDQHNEAEILVHVGETRHAQGEIEAAGTALREALTIMTRLEHPNAEEVGARLAALGLPATTGS